MVISEHEVDLFKLACRYGLFRPVLSAIQLAAARQIGYTAGHDDGYWEGRNYPAMFEDTDDVTNF